MSDAAERSAGSAAQRRLLPGIAYAALLGAFVAVALLVYRPALDGRFMSDDVPHLVANPYVQELSVENVVAILHPFGPPVAYTLNYAPVHLLVHALGVHLWGNEPRAFRILNVSMHALCSVLLVALLVAGGVSASLAVLAGGVFLLHPANVEAVAFVFQLKTLLSTALAFLAILLLWRHPLLATLLFAAALLAKINAVFAWPVAVAWAWARSAPGRGEAARGGWLVAWAAIALLVAIPELMAAQRGGEHVVRTEDLVIQVRTLFAIVARYLAMAATTWGLAAFHQPDPARSWLDPWWLGGLLTVLALGTRSVVTLARRQVEAAFWVMAAASYAPVSQLLPFVFPMADRYLYGILPGLMGGALLAGREVWAGLASRDRGRSAPEARPPGFQRALAVGLAALLLVGLATRSQSRTWVYRTEANLRHDSAARYPDGLHGHMLRAERAASAGDVAGVADGLRGAFERGYVGFLDLVDGRGSLAPYRDRPEVDAVLREMAAWWVERGQRIVRPVQIDLYMVARAHEVLGQREEALGTLSRALELGGPHDAMLRLHLERIRGEGGGAGPGAPEQASDPPGRSAHGWRALPEGGSGPEGRHAEPAGRSGARGPWGPAPPGAGPVPGTSQARIRASS